MNIGFLASGRGSNMQSVIDACCSGRLHARPCVVISNNSRAGAIDRAKHAHVPYRHLSSVTHPDPSHLDYAIRDILVQHQTNLVVLAGYMKKLGPQTLSQFAGQIVNIHPALLPSFGGAGMYGPRVHRAVLASGATESGATVHLVNAEYDQGPILAQRRVPVLPDDSPESLARRVMEQEHMLLVETLEGIVEGRIVLPKS